MKNKAQQQEVTSLSFPLEGDFFFRLGDLRKLEIGWSGGTDQRKESRIRGCVSEFLSVFGDFFRIEGEAR